MRQLEGVTVLELGGQILFGESSGELQLNVRSLVEEGRLRIVLDLGRVTAIDACGVGTLAAAHTTLATRSGRLALVRPAGRVAELLAITGLNTVFHIFETEADAIASFEKLRERLAKPLEFKAVPGFRENSSIL
jgi:anti-sigma B factor antagonist